MRIGVDTRKLNLFDSFSGMSDTLDQDVHIWSGKTGKDLIGNNIGGAPGWEAVSVEGVQSAFADTAYPTNRLHFVVGR